VRGVTTTTTTTTKTTTTIIKHPSYSRMLKNVNEVRKEVQTLGEMTRDGIKPQDMKRKRYLRKYRIERGKFGRVTEEVKQIYIS
jgi:murein L,D-transpeptidase YcbB/YkuD